MNKLNPFLKRKKIIISYKRYGYDALQAMALGLFSSLVVGLIIKTIGLQTELWFGVNLISSNLVTLGSFAMTYLGAAIGVAVAYKLEAPAYVLFTSLITGALGAVTGGPAGAFISALVAAEFGKAVSNETKLDLIVTPAVTMIVGYLVSLLVSPAIGQFMTFLGNIILYATSVQPLLTGIIIAVVVGLALSGPISSAALAIMLGLSGLAAGAATAGCAAHMIGFAFMSYK
ncbi:MAG: PTS sugar transporter subunit IIC, partial [Erysipelotrichaceae bacterium]